MSRVDDNKHNHVFGPHIVAYFDLLGQQDVLRSLNSPPDRNDAEAVERYKGKVKEMYGSVYMLRKFFMDSFKAFASSGVDYSHLTEEQKAQFERFRLTDIRSQHFSDTVVVFMPVRAEVNPVPLRAAFGIFSAAAISYLSCLYHGRPIRGAIEIGMGMELGQNEIYGPVLASVYNLEGKVAQYPRIIVGPELVGFLHQGLQETADDNLSEMNRTCAARCLDLLATDDDGNVIVDFLGGNFKTMLEGKFSKDVIVKGYDVIQAQLAQATDKGDAKLVDRYKRLVDYYELRKPVWNE